MTDTQIPRKAETMVDDDETVIEVAERKSAPALVSGVIASLLFFGFMGGFFGVFALAATQNVLIGAGVALLIGGVFVGWTVLNVVMGGATYVITDEKALSLQENLGESDMEYVEFEDAKTIDVSEGLLDSIFDTGTVEVEAYKADDVKMSHVENPYDIAETARDRM